MNDADRSGIYGIKNLETGAMYIGQTAQAFARRWGKHRRALKAGQHINDHLQNSYNKHGKDVFEYKVLEVIPQCDMSDQEFLDYMNAREIILIAEHNTLENGYNQTDGGGGVRGFTYTPSEEHKAKISAAKKGKALSAEHRARLSAAHKGYKFTDEARANMSAALKGKKHGPMSKEQKVKLSVAMKGKPWTAARRAAQEARKGGS